MSYELHFGPHTDFHDLDIEWVITEMRKAVAAWKESETYWTTAQNAFNDMKESFDENTAGYTQQWPAFQNKINAEIAEMQEIVNDSHQMIESFETAISSMETQLSEMETNVTTITEKTTNIEIEIETINTSLTDISNNVTDNTESIEKIENKIQLLQNTVESQNKSLSSINKTLIFHQEEIEEILEVIGKTAKDGLFIFTNATLSELYTSPQNQTYFTGIPDQNSDYNDNTVFLNSPTDVYSEAFILNGVSVIARETYIPDTIYRKALAFNICLGLAYPEIMAASWIKQSLILASPLPQVEIENQTPAVTQWESITLDDYFGMALRIQSLSGAISEGFKVKITGQAEYNNKEIIYLPYSPNSVRIARTNGNLQTGTECEMTISNVNNKAQIEITSEGTLSSSTRLYVGFLWNRV